MKNPRLVVAMIAIVACVTVFAENKVEKIIKDFIAK